MSSSFATLGNVLLGMCFHMKPPLTSQRAWRVQRGNMLRSIFQVRSQVRHSKAKMPDGYCELSKCEEFSFHVYCFGRGYTKSFKFRSNCHVNGKLSPSPFHWPGCLWAYLENWRKKRHGPVLPSSQYGFSCSPNRSCFHQ